MGSIRFIRNVNLKVNFEGDETMVPFSSGDIYTATGIDIDAEGYCDINMPDGSVLQGVAKEVFENMGKKVPVTIVAEIATVIENAEILVEEQEPEIAVLDGTMRSADGDWDAPTTTDD